MSTLLRRIDEPRKGAGSRSVLADRRCFAGDAGKFDRSLSGLVDSGRLMRDIGLGVLCGVGIGVLVAMIGDLC
jgi:hypothetical protein